MLSSSRIQQFFWISALRYHLYTVYLSKKQQTIFKGQRKLSLQPNIFKMEFLYQTLCNYYSAVYIFCSFLTFSSNANPHQWTVSFGTTINPPLMKRNVRRIIVHERYRSPAREYDIAVVQFSPRITFTDDIRRVCLPEASAVFQPNSTAYITGFGALFYGGRYLEKDHRALCPIQDSVTSSPSILSCQPFPHSLVRLVRALIL